MSLWRSFLWSISLVAITTLVINLFIYGIVGYFITTNPVIQWALSEIFVVCLLAYFIHATSNDTNGGK